MKQRLLVGLLLALVARPVAADKPADKPRIDQLEARLAGDHVDVSFHVVHAVAEETLDRLRSGIPVRHRHRVDVLARRTLWPSKELGRLRIDTSAVYDALTQRFGVSRTIRSRTLDRKQWVVLTDERHTTESVDELLDWMSVFETLPAIELPAAVKEARLRVRVESTLGRRFVFYLFPARLTLSAERKPDR